MKCPLCQSETVYAFETKGFPLRDCAECGHRFAAISAGESHVAEVYDNSYFSDGGAGYTDYLQEGEMLEKRGRMYAKRLKKFGFKTGKMIDVGSAAGFILQGFVAEGWQGIGIEPNAAMAKAGREKSGLDIRQSSFESFSGSGKFDLVSMIQVAAHFYSPREAFQKTADILNENGILLIETWNRDSISARIFGKSWHEYSPPSVLQWFSLNGLTNFLKEFGFKKIAHGRPGKKISGAHAKSLLKYRLGDNFLLKLIPDKINFPYPDEDLFWAIYQKNND